MLKHVSTGYQVVLTWSFAYFRYTRVVREDSRLWIYIENRPFKGLLASPVIKNRVRVGYSVQVVY